MLSPELPAPHEERIHLVADAEAAPSRSENNDLQFLLAAARRQQWVFVVCSIFGVLLGITYLKSKTPDYTATAALFIDNEKARAVQDAYQAMVQRDFEAGNSFLDTQVELLGSDSIVFSVIDKLELLQDPEFADDKASPVSMVLPSLLRASVVATDPGTSASNVGSLAHRRVADVLKRHVEIRRIPRTPILQIVCKSQSAEKAAKIANGFAEAYLADQLQANYDATRRAGAWLQERIAELKERVLASDLALQKFKAENELISSGGRLVPEQQLAEVNTQLVNARAETARAAARHEQIKTLRENRRTDALLAESIPNPFFEQLRQKYIAAAKREAELSVKVGHDHGSVVTLRQEMREYEKLMFQELGHIEDMYLNELEVARSREKSLSESLAGLVAATASTEKRLVTLRELQRESDSYRTLYQTMLQRNQEVLQTHSFPISESRLVLSAWPPDHPSHPKAVPVLALALALGAGLGGCVGAVREFRDRAFRTGRQVNDELQLELLGMLPHVESDGPASLRRSSSKRRQKAQPTHAGEGKLLGRVPALMRYVLDHPLSGYAEALSTIKILADATLPGRPCKKIGIVSVLPGEGKTTVAFNLGLLLAQINVRTLLVDADLRNPQLTRRAVGDAREGLLSAASKDLPIDDILVRDESLPLALLPAVVKKAIPHTWAVLRSPGVERAVKQAEKLFDFILFDLPPMGPVLDVSAFTPQLDAIVFVVEWGRTSRKLVRTMLDTNPRVRDLCLGVILNNVDRKKLKRYESYDSKEFYEKQYGAYYRDDPLSI
jgi:succinoglycan biosynthesis transport protein ExoP